MNASQWAEIVIIIIVWVVAWWTIAHFTIRFLRNHRLKQQKPTETPPEIPEKSPEFGLLWDRKALNSPNA